MKHWRWKDGRKLREMPRKLYCVNEVVLLVSSIYLCEESNHEIISHDPSVLHTCTEVGIEVPFYLFHRSGATKEQFDYIATSMQTGMTIKDIETHLMTLYSAQHSRRACEYYHAQGNLQKDSTQQIGNITFPVFEVNKNFIGRTLISRVFMRLFFKSENMFR